MQCGHYWAINSNRGIFAQNFSAEESKLKPNAGPNRKTLENSIKPHFILFVWRLNTAEFRHFVRFTRDLYFSHPLFSFFFFRFLIYKYVFIIAVIYRSGNVYVLRENTVLLRAVHSRTRKTRAIIARGAI